MTMEIIHKHENRAPLHYGESLNMYVPNMQPQVWNSRRQYYTFTTSVHMFEFATFK